MALTRSGPDADDLVQAAVERALARTGQIDAVDRLDRWMFRIIRTVWLNMCRASAVRRAESLDGHEEDLVMDGSRAVEASLDLQRVQAAFERLGEEQRAPLLLVCIEGYSYAEAAELIGIPLGTLTSRLVRGRAALAAALAEPVPGNVTILQRKGKP